MRLTPWHGLLLLLLVLAAPAAGWFIGRQINATPSVTPVATAVVPAADPSPSEPAVTQPMTTPSPPRPEPSREVVSKWTTMALALEESRQNGKPVLLDFNAEWCGPCRSLKRELFDEPTLGRSVQKVVIPVSLVDRTREEGRNLPEVEELQRRYHVDAFPTLIVFSPATGNSVQMRGYGDARQTLSWITEAALSMR